MGRTPVHVKRNPRPIEVKQDHRHDPCSNRVCRRQHIDPIDVPPTVLGADQVLIADRKALIRSHGQAARSVATLMHIRTYTGAYALEGELAGRESYPGR